MTEPPGADLDPATVSLTIGEQHEIVLPGLGTAGYRWDEQVTGDETAVALDWQRGFRADEAQGRRIGQSAPERLTVTARAPGRVEIALRQSRPWESGPPRAEQRVVVEVRAS